MKWRIWLLRQPRAFSDATMFFLNSPSNPFGHTMLGRNIAASAELFERMTRRYGKPSFNLSATVVAGQKVPVTEQVVWERPFCRLLHFSRALPPLRRPQPRLLIVAPISGHYATLLRGTVEAFLPDFDVYVTDWGRCADGSPRRGVRSISTTTSIT